MWISHPRHPCWRWWWMTVVGVMALQVITPIYSQGCITSEKIYGVCMVICNGTVTRYWWPGQDISEITLQLPGRNKTIIVNSSHHQQWHKVTVTDDGVMKDKATTRSGKTYSLTIPTLSVAEVIDCTDKTKPDLRVTSNQKMFWATNCTNIPSEWWIYLVPVLALAPYFGLLIFIIIKCMRLQKSRVSDSPQLGNKFLARTGHKSLLGLFGRGKQIPGNANAKNKRWALLLSQFKYDLEFKSDKDNVVADALNSLSVTEELNFSIPV
nr:uncharacterized protein LOC123748577 [Procambarus clarkii]